MFSKWIIDLKKFDGFVFGEDKNLYRLPYTKNLRSYSLRLIKKDAKRNRWKIDGVWWSQRQIKSHIKLDPNPVELINKSETLF